ncbi:hypothetical protein RIR_jg24235.t1 [Rhizophagus irregularis DAOM 181602=DAOM 197198]|nr:hypothetical protein RIR_jg24235.t1 [Rhizophagus irregularis DAOM 181602=DAOM 197198]
MPPVKKRQKLYKQQFRTSDGRFGTKKRSNNNHPTQYELNIREGTDDVTLELEFSAEEWGDDDDSGWEDEFDLEKEKNTQSKLMMIELEWDVNNEFEKKKRGPYSACKTPKSTYYDKWGPSGSFTKAAFGTSKITSFFPVYKAQSNTDHNIENESEQSGSEEENICKVTNIDARMKALKEELGSQHNKMKVNEYNKKRAIFEYLKLSDENGGGKMEASLNVARMVFVDGGVWKARQIRNWANYWLLHNALPISYQGKHQKTIRLIDDEDVAEECHAWIRDQNYKVMPIKFKEFIEHNLLAKLEINKKKTINISTAVRWLHILGYTKQRQKQGIFYDGHERADVVQYRNDFLKQIFEYERLMSRYEGENMDRILPDLAEGEKEHILVTHDECIFYSNDGLRGVWAKNGELPLRKKGNGKSIMISEFLTEVDGRLKLKPENIEQYPNVPVEAREYLEPGKDREGYWTAENVIEQIKIKAIPIFEVLYPNCIGIFAFDNSSNHAIFAKDALVAKKMNLKPGGLQPKMRDTYWGPDNQLQSMVFSDDHPNEKLRGQPKGLRQILQERKKWPNGGLMLECKECKEKNDDENRINCCARRVMSLEPDFLAQKGAIAEIIEKAGHKCIFYPKFHCELNFIERYWGAAKRHARENCNYSWVGLKQIVPQSLESVSLITIRRFARKAWRYMSLYQKGIGGKLAEYAVKKYRSHRRIPDEVIEELNQIKFD